MKNTMKVVFVSSVELGRSALMGIIESDAYRHGEVSIEAIFSLAAPSTHPFSGYQLFLEAAAFAKCPLEKVQSIKKPEVIDQIASYEPDLLCIIGWSELAPPELLDVPKLKYGCPHRHHRNHGCVGIHPTLLPEGRGRAPIPWTIIKGITNSGVTLFYLEEEADAGDIIASHQYEIDEADDASSVYDKVKRLHYTLMKENIHLLAQGLAPRIPQDPSKATLWPKRTPEDGIIDWNNSQRFVYNWIRALTYPYPGAFTWQSSLKIKCWRSQLGPRTTDFKPSLIVSITDKGIYVSCQDGLIILQKLQIGDGPALTGKEFAEQFQLSIGTSFS